MATKQEIKDMVNKKLKCPFGPCASCSSQRKIKPEECAIAQTMSMFNDFLRAFFKIKSAE